MTSRQTTYLARVQLDADNQEPAAATQLIAIRHHRVPRAVWSIDTPTGGHMLHLALAQCVFNNVVRIAAERGLTLTRVDVGADGGFNADGTASTGIDCSIDLSGDAIDGELKELARAAFDDSSVVAILRRGGPVELSAIHATSAGGT